MECIDKVKSARLPCQNDECRFHLDYPKDLNCTHIAIEKNGEMKLEQIGERLHVTIARIKQICDASLKKLSKKKLLKVYQE